MLTKTKASRRIPHTFALRHSKSLPNHYDSRWKSYYIRCGSQPPKWLSVILASWSSQSWPVKPGGHWRNDVLQLLRLGYQRYCHFNLEILGHWLWGKLLPCHDDTEAGLEVPPGEELRPLANNQHERVGCMSEPCWDRILQPQSDLQMTAAPADILIAISWETLSQNDPVMLLLDSWPKTM